MRFIPKQTLCEGMAANPLEKNVKDSKDITKMAQEGILTAVAAETDAINQYMQISDMIFGSEMWLKELAYDQIQDIINEEKKHLAQLSNIVANLPYMSEQWNEGWKEAETGEDTSEKEEESQDQELKAKESIEESVISEDVNKNRTYEKYGIIDCLKEWLTRNGLDYDEEDVEDIENCFDFNSGNELSVELVDEGIANFIGKFSSEEHDFLSQKSDIENFIMSEVDDPQHERAINFQSDIEKDVETLNDLINKNLNSPIKTQKCVDGINNLIDNLKTLEYNGEKEVEWRF